MRSPQLAAPVDFDKADDSRQDWLGWLAVRKHPPPLMSTRLWAVALLLQGVATVQSLRPGVKPPPFSWDTVPVFAETSNVSGPFDESALHTLARFPVYVAEKAYNYPAPGYAEDKLAALAAELRSINPEIYLIFYYNANLDMDDYRLNAESLAHAPSWWLRNESGVPMVAPVDSGPGSRPPFPYADNKIGGLHCWDHTNPAVRQTWASECTNVTSPAGGFNGCMVDRWTRNPFKGQPGYSAAAIRAWKDAMLKSEQLLLETTQKAGIWLVGEGHDVDAISDPGYGAGTGARKGRADSSLRQQINLAQAGQGLLASYRPGSIGADFTNTLASFLIGGARCAV